MKKTLALILSVMMVSLCLFGCSSGTDSSGSSKSSTKEGKSQKLVVGTMANALGLPVKRAIDAGYFKDAGLNIEMTLFATGAPINEAMSADQLDIAVSGMASVYALATGNYKYVGDGCITVGGQSMYARKDSDIIKSKGKIDGTLGSKDALKGKSVLGPLSTTAHYQAIKYMESFGLTTNDFNMVSMDYAQAYQAFITGQGDLIATISPYNTQLEEAGYVKVCDVALVMGSPQMDTVYTQNDVFDNRRDDVEKFLDCYYHACSDLKNDENLRSELALKWYKEEGKTYTDKDMKQEITNQTYHDYTTLMTDEYKFGSTMTSIGDFFTNQGMIEKENLPNIEASLDSSLVKNLKANNK